MLSHAQIQQFKIDGYLVLPNVLSPQTIKSIRGIVDFHLKNRIEPFELETEVQYPGAPKSEKEVGGDTIRRLKLAYQRDSIFKQLATHSEVIQAIKQILQTQSLLLNPNHHNCIMTKQAKYSSMTMWHRDTRYWQFNNKYLVNAWFALGDEQNINGGMKILPGSHRWDVNPKALDSAQFLILDHPDNTSRLDSQREVNLFLGDVLLFSAHCFHAAGQNQTKKAKYSAVFTYHNEHTQALPNSNSAMLEPIKV